MSTDERPEDTRERETADHGQGYRLLYPRGDGEGQREQPARTPRHSVPRRRNRGTVSQQKGRTR